MNYKNVKIAEGARIAKQSVILGNVTIGRDSCVLYYAVLRGDDAPIVIGEETNIQENCTIHVSHNMPVHIGNNVTVGHNAVLHGCTIGDRTLIGMGSVILDGARIGNDCIIGAGSLVTKNTVIPDGSLVMGSPARIKGGNGFDQTYGAYGNQIILILVTSLIFFCNMCYEAEIVFDKDIFCFRIAPLELQKIELLFRKRKRFQKGFQEFTSKGISL